ncbi:hypothetical protein, partial [Streptomyces anulatus]|uniref:hypothetical protein n=1 Tax=Streptomyces anulatus TaxID=1892 RepID=UPI00343974D7
TDLYASWTSFTPTWTGSTTNPVIGNGTLAGAFLQVGKTIHFRIAMVAGSTTTFGSGTWSFNLPVAAAAVQSAAAFADDFSASARYPGAAWLTSGVTAAGVFRVLFGAGGNTGASSTVPFTWAQSDRLHINGTYEAS